MNAVPLRRCGTLTVSKSASLERPSASRGVWPPPGAAAALHAAARARRGRATRREEAGRAVTRDEDTANDAMARRDESSGRAQL